MELQSVGVTLGVTSAFLLAGFPLREAHSLWGPWLCAWPILRQTCLVSSMLFMSWDVDSTLGDGTRKEEVTTQC